VVLNRNNSLAVVDLRGDRVVAETPVGNAPHAVVVWREVPLNEVNPALARLTGLQLEWALACEEMDFSAPDAADEDLLNRAIWYATKGFDVAYPAMDRSCGRTKWKRTWKRSALERRRGRPAEEWMRSAG